jgi:hypothetical protein
VRAWLAALFLVGVSVTSADSIVQVPAGCVPAALNFEYAYKVKMALSPFAWARIVRVDYPGERPAHAIAVFVTSTGDVWRYDTMSGSIPLGTWSHELSDITACLHRHDPSIVSVEWLD